jgi:hypothetical protein
LDHVADGAACARLTVESEVSLCSPCPGAKDGSNPTMLYLSALRVYWSETTC